MKPFFDTLREVDGGRALEQLDELFYELSNAVRAHDKGGKLTLKIEVKPWKKHDASMVVMSAKTEIDPPTAPAPESLFFMTPEGHFSRRDPNQPVLPGLMPAPDPAETITDDEDQAHG